MNVYLRIAIVSALVCLVTCGPAPGSEGTKCDHDSDCTGGRCKTYTCQDGRPIGRCVEKSCEKDSECERTGSWWECNGGWCAPATCDSM